MLTQFKILGERCSGTHFVQYAISNNFSLTYSHSLITRHFFGHANDVYSEDDISNTLFICVVRDPIEWIDSFFKLPHHVPPENKRSIDAFLKNEWYSIYEEGIKIGEEILEDRNMISQARYKNILELRKAKLDYFLHTMNTKVKYLLLLRYEDLRDDYENTLHSIKIQFNLIQIGNKFTRVDKYKGSYNALYNKKPILLSAEIKEYIRQNIDAGQEKQLGYNIGNSSFSTNNMA
jgi:hypothetical protein